MHHGYPNDKLDKAAKVCYAVLVKGDTYMATVKFVISGFVGGPFIVVRETREDISDHATMDEARAALARYESRPPFTLAPVSLDTLRKRQT